MTTGKGSSRPRAQVEPHHGRADPPESCLRYGIIMVAAIVVVSVPTAAVQAAPAVGDGENGLLSEARGRGDDCREPRLIDA